MPRDAQWAVQEAIYNMLLADAGLVAATFGIYDHVPASLGMEAYPRVVVGDSTLADWDTDTSFGAEQTLTFHVYSTEPGRKEVKELLAHLYRIMHEQRITVANHTTVFLRREFSETSVEGDGATRHGVARYRIIVEEV